MRKFVPYIITAVLAATVAFAVSYFVSHSNIVSNTVASIADGEKREWPKHYTGGNFLKPSPKPHHSSKWPQFWGRGPQGVEHALLKLTVAKEKGLLSEKEYETVVSILIGPMLGLEDVKLDIDIKTTIIKSDSDSEQHDSDKDNRDDD